MNGVETGSRAGAFTGFTFEATGAMKRSGNILEIEVTNEYDADVPPLSADFDLCGDSTAAWIYSPLPPSGVLTRMFIPASVMSILTMTAAKRELNSEGENDPASRRPAPA